MKATKVNKINNTSTQEEKKTKVVFEEYFNFNTFREMPICEDDLMVIAKDFIEWCRNSEGTKASQFYNSRGIHATTMQRWVKARPRFAEAYYCGLSILGDKREQGALEKKYSEKMVMHRMHAYDPEWKDSDKYHSRLKKDQNSGFQGNIILSDSIMNGVKDEYRD